MNKIKGYRFDKYFFEIESEKLIDETDNSSIRLNETDFKVLKCLLENYPKSVSRSELIKQLKYEIHETNKLHQSIRRLRDKLKDRAIINENQGYLIYYKVTPVSDGNSSQPDQPNIDASPIAVEPTIPTDIFEPASLASKWKIAFQVSLLSFIALLIITTIIFIKSRKNDDGFTKITISKAFVHLDLSTPDWKDLSEEERNSKEKKSTAYFEINYKVIKHFDVDTFLHRLGTTSNIPPELQENSDHTVSKTIDVTDTSKKCSSSNVYSKLIYFDISNEILRDSFDLSFKVDYFNAHNRQKGEYQQFFIHRPMENLDFKISFPKTAIKNFPKIRFQKSKGCNEQFIPENPIDINSLSPNEDLTTLSQYVINDASENTVVWHIKNPTVNNIYRIEWDWQ